MTSLVWGSLRLAPIILMHVSCKHLILLQLLFDFKSSLLLIKISDVGMSPSITTSAFVTATPTLFQNLIIVTLQLRACRRDKTIGFVCHNFHIWKVLLSKNFVFQRHPPNGHMYTELHALLHLCMTLCVILVLLSLSVLEAYTIAVEFRSSLVSRPSHVFQHCIQG